jgi:hypothetical protein
MTESDPVLRRLGELPALEPDPALSAEIRKAAHRALTPRRVHPVWTFAAALSVVTYLGWAVYFTSHLY